MTYEDTFVAAFRDELEKLGSPHAAALSEEAVAAFIKEALGLPSLGTMAGQAAGAVGGALQRGAGAAMGMAQRGAGALGGMAQRGASALGGLAQRGASAVGGVAQQGTNFLNRASQAVGQGLGAARSAVAPTAQRAGAWLGQQKAQLSTAVGKEVMNSPHTQVNPMMPSSLAPYAKGMGHYLAGKMPHAVAEAGEEMLHHGTNPVAAGFKPMLGHAIQHKLEHFGSALPGMAGAAVGMAAPALSALGTGLAARGMGGMLGRLGAGGMSHALHATT